MTDEFVNAYVDGYDLVLLRREGDRLVRKTTKAEWISYFKVADLPMGLRRDLAASKWVRSTRQEGEWLRVGWHDPLIRDAMCGLSRRRDAPPSPIVAANIPHYEADVHAVMRYFVDTGAGIQRPRRCFLDIETDSRVPFSRKEEARILSWAVVDENENVVAEAVLPEDSHAAERDLLYQLWAALLGFDQVLAWSGDGFDFPVIDARTMSLGVKVDTRPLLRLDHLLAFERMNRNAAESGEEKRSMKLNAIAMALKVGEKDRFDSSRTWDAWKNAEPCGSGDCMRCRACLLRYNRQDTILLPRIERKTGFAAVFAEVAATCRVFPDTRGLNPTRQVDGLMLRLGAERGLHFPTRQYREEGRKMKGAFVMEPKFKGIVRNVHVCDFSGMYPSIILSWNMSPETKRVGPVNGPIPEGMCRCPLTGTCFDSGAEGILCTAIRLILEQRKYWNNLKASLPPNTPEWVDADRRSNALKVIANCFFGVVSSIYSRFYDPDIGEGITQNGRWLIEQTMGAATMRDMDPGYGDTDSSFIAGTTQEAFAEFVKWCNAELYPEILKKVGCTRNEIKLAYEKEFDLLCMAGKKRYCNPPETPMLMGDFSHKPLGSVRVGDVVMGWADGVGRCKRSFRPTEVVAVHSHRARLVKVWFESGAVLRCTPDHKWLRARKLMSKRGGKRYDYPWCEAKVGRSVVRVLSEPRQLDEQLAREAAWLGGIYDGEGSLGGPKRNQITISQSPSHNPQVCARIERVLTALGFRWCVSKETSGCNRYVLSGGKQARLNFFTWCRPAKWEALRDGMLRAYFGNVGDRIVAIEPAGVSEVIGLTTESGNYVAWGCASKNCGTFVHYKGKKPNEHTKPEVKGFEYKRGDAALLAARMQEEAIMMICESPDRGPPALGPEPYVALVERWRRRILVEPLAPAEVIVSQSLTKSLKEYKSKTKKDGSDGNDLAHVNVAKVLLERGQEVREGTRIEYFVIDGSVSPAVVAPAEDYGKSDVDRYYLWEKKVYPPTMRLLEAAFPTVKWDQYERVRPAKPRGGRGRMLPGQLALDVRGGAAPPVAPIELMVGPEREAAIAAVLRQHRGTRPAILRIMLASGGVAVSTEVFSVSDGEGLRRDVEAVFAAT